MKTLFPLLLSSLFLISCSSYQYVSLKSEAPKTEKSNHYYYETDDLYIDFSFSGSQFPIDIYIENMGDEDLYIDLSRSLFIEDRAVISSFITSPYTNHSSSIDLYGDGVVDMEIPADPEYLFIPPGVHAKMVYRVFHWTPDKYYKQNGEFNSRPGKDGYSTAERVYTFGEGEGPKYEVHIRLANNKEMEDELVLSFPFTPDKVITTSQPPSNFAGFGADTFHHSLQNNTGSTVLSLLLLLGMTVLVANAEPETN